MNMIPPITTNVKVELFDDYYYCCFIEMLLLLTRRCYFVASKRYEQYLLRVGLFQDKIGDDHDQAKVSPIC